jgi:hypothetical protein
MGESHPQIFANTEENREKAYSERVKQNPDQPPTLSTPNENQHQNHRMGQQRINLETTLGCLPPAPGGPLVQGPPSMQRGFANVADHTRIKIQPLSTAPALLLARTISWSDVIVHSSKPGKPPTHSNRPLLRSLIAEYPGHSVTMCTAF